MYVSDLHHHHRHGVGIAGDMGGLVDMNGDNDEVAEMHVTLDNTGELSYLPIASSSSGNSGIGGDSERTNNEDNGLVVANEDDSADDINDITEHSSIIADNFDERIRDTFSDESDENREEVEGEDELLAGTINFFPNTSFMHMGSGADRVIESEEGEEDFGDDDDDEGDIAMGGSIINSDVGRIPNMIQQLLGVSGSGRIGATRGGSEPGGVAALISQIFQSSGNGGSRDDAGNGHIVVSHRVGHATDSLPNMLPEGSRGVQLRIHRGDGVDVLHNWPMPSPAGQPRLQRVRMPSANSAGFLSPDGNDDSQPMHFQDFRSMFPFMHGASSMPRRSNFNSSNATHLSTVGSLAERRLEPQNPWVQPLLSETQLFSNSRSIDNTTYTNANNSGSVISSVSLPSIHPLLGLGGSGRGGGSGVGSRGYAALESIVSAVDSSGHHGMYGSSLQSVGSTSQAQLAARRRPLYPYVSDRRWGTDVGEMEVAGGRITTFTAAFINSSIVQEMQRMESVVENDNVKKEKREREAELEGQIRSMKNEMDRVIKGQVEWEASHRLAADVRGVVSACVDVFQEEKKDLEGEEEEEETKEEREEDMQETKEGDVVDIHEGRISWNTSDTTTAGTSSAESTSSRQRSSSDTGCALIANDNNRVITNTRPPADEDDENKDQGMSDTGTASSYPLNSSNSSSEMAPKASNTEVSGSSTSDERQSNGCPPGYDEEVWCSLPEEMQQELLAEMGFSSSDAVTQQEDMLTSTSLDRDALAELPSALRNEILQEEATERRRRRSIDENLTSNATLAMENQEGESQSQPPATESNASFLASLSPDLRTEVLLSADAAFLSTLPEATQIEARNLQAQHGIIGGLAAAHAQFYSRGGESQQSSGGRGGQLEEEVQAQPASRRQAARNRRFTDIAALSTNSRQPSNSEDRAAKTAATDALATKRRISLQLTGDRLPPAPFSRRLAVRLILQLYSSKRAKLSKPFLKLLVGVCRYQLVRKWVIRAILALMFNDPDQLWTSLQKLTNHNLRDCLRLTGGDSNKVMVKTMPLSKGEDICSKSSTDPSLISQLDDFATLINSISDLEMPVRSSNSSCDYGGVDLDGKDVSPTPVTLRRLLHALNYLCRKTDRLVWYDIMFPCNANRGGSIAQKNNDMSASEERNDDEWMFGRLVLLLLHPVLMSSGANTDHMLHLMEDLLSPLNKLTVADANSLVLKQRKNEHKLPSGNVMKIWSDTAGSPETKRLRTGSNATTEMTTEIENLGFVDDDAKHESKNSNGAVSRVDIPFPVLSVTHARILASVVQSRDSTGVFRSRLSRILRVLSLHDGNWHQLLHHLSAVAESVAQDAIKEARVVQQLLLTVIESGGNATSAMALPQLSSPSSVPELHMLQVLQLMTDLRNAAPPNEEGDDAATQGFTKDSDIDAQVSKYVKRIDFQDLWDLLVGSLDLVRYLEGITDTDADDSPIYKNDDAENRGGSSSSSHYSDDSHKTTGEEAAEKDLCAEEKKMKSRAAISSTTPQTASSLSALTMRFMPLIECFLTVCGSTVLKRDRNVNSTNSITSSNLSPIPGVKRAREENEEKVNSGSIVSAGPAEKPDLRIKDNQMPGLRFRQSVQFRHMQRDLDLEGESCGDGHRLLTFIERNRLLLNMVLRQNVNLLETSFSPLAEIPRCRSLLHFDIKRAFFKMKLKRMKQTLMSNRSSFGTQKLSVNRETLLEDSFQQLRFASTSDMRKRLSVSFHGEEGIDAGGVTREWYSLISKAMFNEGYMLFVNPTGDKVTFQPNPQSGVYNPHHLDYFKFIGRVIGKAICDGFLLDAHFTRSFYKHILGQSISYHDLEAIDPTYYKNMMTLLSMNHDDVQYLDLTFSAEVDLFGETKIVDLVENGRNIAVTGDNILDYVQQDAHHRMTAAILKQLNAFLEGFHDLVPAELVSIFDAQELELLISGLPTIDLEDLRAHTEYHGYKLSDPIITWFWNVLRGFSDEEKALFLQFVTGSSKVPLDGFQDLRGSRGVQMFSIHKAFGASNLPCAHTCFNQLDLPEYASEEDLKEKLMLAIREGSEGFGIV